MFIDNTILNIIFRSTGLSTERKERLYYLYLNMIREATLYIAINYYEEKGKIKLNTMSDMITFTNKFIKDSENNIELKKVINEEMDNVNSNFIKQFASYANQGDVIYLRVYLASQIQKIRELKKKIQEWESKKGEKRSLSDIVEKPIIE